MLKSSPGCMIFWYVLPLPTTASRMFCLSAKERGWIWLRAYCSTSHTGYVVRLLGVGEAACSENSPICFINFNPFLLRSILYSFHWLDAALLRNVIILPPPFSIPARGHFIFGPWNISPSSLLPTQPTNHPACSAMGFPPVWLYQLGLSALEAVQLEQYYFICIQTFRDLSSQPVYCTPITEGFFCLCIWALTRPVPTAR